MAKFTIKSEYRIEDKVFIKELDRPGRVKSISLDCFGLQYFVRYFADGSVKTVWFYADEIKGGEKL